MSFNLILSLVCVMLTLALASCPNKCSGHGSCGASDVCSCDTNWLGGDCSQRQCQFSRAWVDTAQNANDAHYYAECANRGKCNRATGLCKCDKGFTGVGCRRMACPNSCSGHGTCEFIEEIAVDVNDKRLAGATANTYSAWDTEKIMGCKCDGGYEGHDCSAKVCPYGDDPLTSTTQYEMDQYVISNTNVAFYLTYYDQYGNAWTTEEINGGTLSADEATVCAAMQTALRKLPNHALDLVTVAAEAGTISAFTRTTGSDVHLVGAGTTATESNGAAGAAWRCIVSFPAEPGATGKQHLLGCSTGGRTTAGMQPMVAGTASTCWVGESVAASTTVRMLTESKECSGRGICDSEAGVCTCFEGHRGIACEKQEALV